ncbi:MAG: N-acetyltransferase [Candidatus Hydrogenedentota bacterium]|nr:MAG: N-acetyltransferase [Candidatus Hydrogenedentota bacterium]
MLLFTEICNSRMKNPFLIGEKVYLRPVEPEDADILAACNNDPEVRVSFFTHTPTNLYQQRKHAETLYTPGADYIPFVIVPLEGNDDRGIGITALHRVDLVSHAAVYSIRICDSSQWGKGYGSEVTRLMLHYAFDILNLHRVQLHVWCENQRGIRAYEKAGFVREGLLREAMMHNGKYCDFYVMGILEHEWRARQQNAG